jgi:plastocyanin
VFHRLKSLKCAHKAHLVNEKTAKGPFPVIRNPSLSIIVFVSLILLSWQFFYSVDAQDDGKEDDTENINDNYDDSTSSVIIPENAAWSESVDGRFDPSNITIPVGTEVIWINGDESQHTVTSGNLTNQGRDGIYDGRFYSGTLGSEDSFSHTFNEPGIYSYFCSPHPWMNGFVLVEQDAADMQDDEEEESNDEEEEQDSDDE